MLQQVTENDVDLTMDQTHSSMSSIHSNWEQLPTPKDRVKHFGYIRQAGLISFPGIMFLFSISITPHPESSLILKMIPFQAP